MNQLVAPSRPPSWKWMVCGLLLLATMLNYMDRLTLSQLAPAIRTEYGLSNEQYGDIEWGFGWAFAAGAFCFGFLVDKIGTFWLYPLVLIGWSLAGMATAHADVIGSALLEFWNGAGADSVTAQARHSQAAYFGFMACRIALGFCEAGHWPCALVTTQTILNRKDRSLGNSILQSGAAFGAILTPLIVQAMVATEPGPNGAVPLPGEWRAPFVMIGIIGMAWVIPWLTLVRSPDLVRTQQPIEPVIAPRPDAAPASPWRRFVVLLITVVMINTTWQFFRVWLPMFLEKHHGYSFREAGYFTSAYYIAADIGCISAGFIVKGLVSRGASVHGARLATFGFCALLTSLSIVAAFLERGPRLLILLLMIGAGALGLFPKYYSFSQELTKTHQGKITGILGATGWLVTSPLQSYSGRVIDTYHTYAPVIIIAGIAPLIAVAAFLMLWEKKATQRASATPASATNT